MESITFFTQSSEETQEAGRQIARQIRPSEVLYISGDLGAGKTTFMKGFSEALIGINPLEVSSPTFTYLNIYSGTQKIYHFDLYRLRSSEEFLSMGFHEFFFQKGIYCCVEWPDRIPEQLIFPKVFIEISYRSSEERKISLRRPAYAL